MSKTPKKRTKPTLTGKTGDTPHITLRVPPAEKAAWQAKATAAGMKLSAWIRSTLNRASKR